MNHHKLIPPKELAALLQEMERAAKQAEVKSFRLPELASGIRITCQDAELHFETFIGFDRPLILSTIPYGHPPLPFSCIVDRLILAKLCRVIALTGIKAITISGSESGVEICSPEANFCYRITAYSNPENFPANRLQYHSVLCNTINIEEQTTTPEPIMITVANNYFQDLEAAITAGAITKNGKNPKKADLYEAIEAHNKQASELQVAAGATVGFHASSKDGSSWVDEFNQDAWDSIKTPSDIPTLEATGDEAALQDALLAMDAVEDAQPKPQKIKAPSKLDRLAQAIADGIEDIDQLAALSGMKPQGVKGWVGVIRNRGVDNWKQACKKSA